MFTRIIPPTSLYHQGGWDEMLMFLVPALLLTWLRNKQKNENLDEQLNKQKGQFISFIVYNKNNDRN